MACNKVRLTIACSGASEPPLQMKPADHFGPLTQSVRPMSAILTILRRNRVKRAKLNNKTSPSSQEIKPPEKQALINKEENQGARTAGKLDLDQKSRLWDHGIHEDKLFHDRMNFFTVLQSAILGMFGLFYNRQPPPGKIFLYGLIGLGLALSVVWLLIQLRHYAYLNHIVGRLKEHLDEFRETADGFSQKKRWRRFSVTRILALFIPILFTIVWLGLLIFLKWGN